LSGWKFLLRIRAEIIGVSLRIIHSARLLEPYGLVQRSDFSNIPLLHLD